MYVFAGIRFEMRSRDSDSLGLSIVEYDEKLSTLHDWDIELRYLIRFGTVRIEVTLSIEYRPFVYRGVYGISETHSLLHGFSVQYRKSARQTETCRTCIGILTLRETRGAGAEYFRLRIELDMHFQSDYGFKHDDGILSRLWVMAIPSANGGNGRHHPRRNGNLHAFFILAQIISFRPFETGKTVTVDTAPYSSGEGESD
jgi:hypothetical protein